MQLTKMSAWSFMSTKGQGHSLTLVQISDIIFLNFFSSISADFNISKFSKFIIISGYII